MLSVLQGINIQRDQTATPAIKSNLMCRLSLSQYVYEQLVKLGRLQESTPLTRGLGNPLDKANHTHTLLSIVLYDSKPL